MYFGQKVEAELKATACRATLVPQVWQQLLQWSQPSFTKWKKLPSNYDSQTAIRISFPRMNGHDHCRNKKTNRRDRAEYN